MNNVELKFFYERYGPMVYRRCLKLINNKELALELMQDTFIKFANYNSKNIYPSSLLYKIATNLSLNYIKKERHNINLDFQEESSQNSEAIFSKNVLEKMFFDEKTKYLEIAVFYFLDGMTLEELSTETGMSVSGIRKILDRLKNKAISFKE